LPPWEKGCFPSGNSSGHHDHMTQAPAIADVPVSVPRVADRLGMGVDQLRKHLLRNATAAAFFVKAGSCRVTLASRIPALAEVLGITMPTTEGTRP
jgi:hypothetical protein